MNAQSLVCCRGCFAIAEYCRYNDPNQDGEEEKNQVPPGPTWHVFFCALNIWMPAKGVSLALLAACLVWLLYDSTMREPDLLGLPIRCCTSLNH